jgi:gliding motility-associated-like protein
MVKRYTKTLLTLVIALTGIAFSANAQLTVQGGQTPQSLVQNVLVGTGVTVNNINFVGDANQIGSFNGQNSNIGINSGIILSTGSILTAPGVGGDFSSTNLGLPGDGDLDALTTQPTEDAAVLTFDFVPLNDTVVFNYVFASEEYPEFVNTGFNDVFAFFISGPGYPNATNLALIPGSSTAVTINNVNDGTNSQYYIDNSTGATVAFDGFTVKLQALAIVVPCSTYTLKIAIADAGDDAYDSAVFLEAQSLTSGNADISISANSVANVNDSLIVEGCIDGVIAFVRGGDITDTTVVSFGIGGSATNGVDYTQIADSVVFYPGDTLVLITIDALYDGIAEGNENVVIILQQNTICQNVPPQIVSIVITNVNPIVASITPSNPQVTPCSPAQITASATGGFGPYTYAWDNNLPPDSSHSVNPSQTTTYNVTISDSCGTPVGTASVTVTVGPPPPIVAQISMGDTIVCDGTVTFTASATGGQGQLSYTWSNNDPSLTQTVTPTETTTYTITFTDSCGSTPGVAEITVSVICELELPNVFTPNGDGQNDTFVIGGLELYPNSVLMVYNRWGRKVFQSDNYLNDWGGDGLSDGVYYFILDVPAKPDKKHGTVTILK